MLHDVDKYAQDVRKLAEVFHLFYMRDRRGLILWRQTYPDPGETKRSGKSKLLIYLYQY